jgi:NitT/TauT family transport system permease protein
MNEALAILSPNQAVSKRVLRTLVIGQIVIFVLYWAFLTPAVIPKPAEVLESLKELWGNGLVMELITSLSLYAEALLCATVFSMLLAYASTIAFFKPVANFWAKLRFLGLVGLPFLFTLYVQGAHNLKLALLTFSISVFMITSMLDVVDLIPKEKYDLARTLRMNEWQVLWEVVILGRIDVCFDVIRQNAAIGWMMLPMIEGLFRSEGGIGVLLDTQSKYFKLSEVAALQIAILMLGLGQDYLIGVIKGWTCPYANLLLERR